MFLDSLGGPRGSSGAPAVQAVMLNGILRSMAICYATLLRYGGFIEIFLGNPPRLSALTGRTHLDEPSGDPSGSSGALAVQLVIAPIAPARQAKRTWLPCDAESRSNEQFDIALVALDR